MYSSSLSPQSQADRLPRAPDVFQHFQRLQIHFRGQLRAQLKPLAQAIGVSENTVRNGGNIVRINGREVRPAVVNGRLTYDLAEVAEAPASTDIEAPVPKVQAPRGRPRKAGLDAVARSAA